MPRRLLPILLVASLWAAAPAGAQQYLDPTPPWPQLLPPAPTLDNRQPQSAPGCERATLQCVERVIGRLREFRDGYGCDHRAVFSTTYMIVTEVIRDALRDEPSLYEDSDWLIYQDALFADYYYRALEAREAGQPVPEAWQIAFDTAETGDANAAQDMLLGINAHVQRDMPFVLAEVGLRKPDGSSRKRDHDVGNELLARSYEPIVQEIARRYDPIVSTSNSSWHPADDLAGLHLVAEWREAVWRNAERLVEARTPQERAAIAQQIEDNAASSARSIASFPQQPGYRAVRDAYCAEAATFESSGPAGAGSRARLSASRACHRRVRAAVRGRGIRRVRFSLRGSGVSKTVRRPDGRGRFVFRARPRPGRYRVVARVLFASGERGTLRRTVRVCG
jgi:Family of unknown function (DUF5995)